MRLSDEYESSAAAPMACSAPEDHSRAGSWWLSSLALILFGKSTLQYLLPKGPKHYPTAPRGPVLLGQPQEQMRRHMMG